MINYNRDLFDKAGVAYPKQGWTWDEFREAAKALTVKDASGNVTQFGYEVPNQNFFVQPWFFTNGTGVLNDDWTGSNMLDPKVAESLQFLHDLIHVDGVSPIPGKDAMDNQFFAGQVAMISRGHWIVQSAKRARLNMDIAIAPTKESDTTVIGFGGYAVSKTAADPELAQALVARTDQPRDAEGGRRAAAAACRAASRRPRRGLPRLPAERRALLPDAAAHQAGALARQLPGGREDLHPLLHRDDGGRGLDRRRRASRPTPSSTPPSSG